MQLKSRGAAALFPTLLACLAGCSSSPPSARVVADPVTVRVASPPGVPAELVRTFCKGWQAAANAVVEVREYGAGGPASVEADVWVIRPAELGRWAAAGKLFPVPDELRQQDAFKWGGLLPLYREHLLVWDRVPYALPLLGEAPVFCYRSDLCQKDCSHSTAFRPRFGRDLRPPATWQEVDDLAAFFHDNGQPGLPPPPADDEGLEREFYTIAAGYSRRSVETLDPDPDRVAEAFSFHFDLRTGKPRIDAPGFVRALGLLQRWQKLRAPGRDAVGAFCAGQGVALLTDAAEVARMQRKGSVVRDRVGVAEMPGGEVYFGLGARAGDRPVPAGSGGNHIPYLGSGGWIAVVPRTSGRRDEGFDLLAELAGREISRQVALTPKPEQGRGGGGTRAEHFGPAARWDGFDLDKARTDALRDALQHTLEHYKVADPAYRLRTPDEREHREVLRRALRAALDDPGADPAAVLAGVVAEWEKLDRVAGVTPEKRRETYRVSLGLRAR